VSRIFLWKLKMPSKINRGWNLHANKNMNKSVLAGVFSLAVVGLGAQVQAGKAPEKKPSPRPSNPCA
jgi:hypothetical protein